MSAPIQDRRRWAEHGINDEAAHKRRRITGEPGELDELRAAYEYGRRLVQERREAHAEAADGARRAALERIGVRLELELAAGELDPFERWMVNSNVECIRRGERDGEATIATLRAGGYEHVARAVAAVLEAERREAAALEADR